MNRPYEKRRNERRRQPCLCTECPVHMTTRVKPKAYIISMTVTRVENGGTSRPRSHWSSRATLIGLESTKTAHYSRSCER